MINLEGLFVPFVNSVPLLLKSGTKRIMPLFSTKEKYLEAAKWAKFEHADCNVIGDGKQFQSAVIQLHKTTALKFKVALDAHITAKGNTRFQLLKMGEDDE